MRDGAPAVTSSDGRNLDKSWAMETASNREMQNDLLPSKRASRIGNEWTTTTMVMMIIMNMLLPLGGLQSKDVFTLYLDYSQSIIQ